MLTTEDIRFLVVVSNHRTLADAARALNITPPSVTQRIQHIEKKLSLKLLQRPSRVVSLTEEGRVLVDTGISILEDLDELTDKLNESRGDVSGRLRVLAPLGFGNDVITPLLGEYKQAHPRLEVELELSDNPNWANHHKWDVIIYIGHLADSSLKMVSLAPNKRFVCASPEYLSRHGQPKTPQDLKKYQCIALRENNEDVTLWSFTHAVSGTIESVRIRPSLASNEGRVIKDWALQGLGIIMRSEWDVQSQIDGGKLVQLLPDYELPNADIVALVSSAAHERSARVTGFLSLLKEQCQKAPWLNR